MYDIVDVYYVNECLLIIVFYPKDYLVVLLIIYIIWSYYVVWLACISVFCTISFILLLNLSQPSLLFILILFATECVLLHTVSIVTVFLLWSVPVFRFILCVPSSCNLFCLIHVPIAGCVHSHPSHFCIVFPLFVSF